MLDAAQLGTKLRAARVRRGLSQDDVARALGIPRTAVTNIESGTRSVSTIELSKLAELYREPVATFLAQAGASVEDLSVVLPRALPDLALSPDMEAAVQRILALYREGAALRELLGLTADQTLPNYVARPGSVVEAIRQAEAVAQEERRRLGLGTAPIGNIVGVIASQGIWTAATDLPDELSGLFTSHPSIGLAILVNAGHHPLRKRFSYAHEYAHALLDRDQPIVTTERRNAADVIEKRANAFAAAFLMPGEGIADQLRQLDKGSPSRHAQILFSVASDEPMEAEIRPPAGSQSILYQDVAALARHFGVSYEAVVWRLKSLGRLTAMETKTLISRREIGNRYGKLLGFFSDGAAPQDTKREHEQELRTQLTRLAIEAFRRGRISADHVRGLSKKLGFGARDLIELAEAARAE